MELIDTHCHLNDPNFLLDPVEAIQRAREAGVVQLIMPGMDLATSRRAIELAAEFPGVCFAAVGVHPHGILESDFSLGNSIAMFKTLINSDMGSTYESRRTKYGESARPVRRASSPERRIVAMGEIGMDFHHYDAATRAVQREAFVAQLELAVEHDLPAIVHGRDAYSDVFDVIKAHPQSRGVLHSFEASYEVAKQALDLGWLISLTALITYPKYDELREVVKRLPLDRLMLETDSPYLPPQRRRTTHDVRSTGPNSVILASGVAVGARGRNNQPAYLPEIAEMVAKIKGVSADEVARVTTQTARMFFGLPVFDASTSGAFPDS